MKKIILTGEKNGLLQSTGKTGRQVIKIACVAITLYQVFHYLVFLHIIDKLHVYITCKIVWSLRKKVPHPPTMSLT